MVSKSILHLILRGLQSARIASTEEGNGATRETGGCGISRQPLSSAIASWLMPMLLLLAFFAQPGHTQGARSAAPAPANGLSIRSIDAGPSSFDSSTVQISAPAGIALDGLHVKLNGVEVRSQFADVSCATTCLSATFSSSSKGARQGQNVLSAYVTTPDGRVLSARYPFDLATQEGANAAFRSAAQTGVRSNAINATDTGDGGSSFLPPSVLLQTLTPGGWQGPGKPWIQVGTQMLPTTTDACTSTYFVIVLDRQTLAEKTDQCVADGADSSNLTSYLKGLTSSELAIVGTTANHGALPKLDTTSIGGSTPSTTTGYMAIGGGQTTAGTGFENFAQAQYFPIPWPKANGLLQQDTSGNYNFWASGAREFTVDPAFDKSDTTSTVATVTVETTSADQANGILRDRYVIPTPTTNGGYWLLVMDRTFLTPTTLSLGSKPQGAFGQGPMDPACSQGTVSNGVRTFTGCGTLYNTGALSGTGYDPNSEYQKLGDALKQVSPYQLIFLVSFGTPACCGDSYTLAYSTNYAHFALWLENLGVSSTPTLFMSSANNYNPPGPTPNQVYTLVASLDTGNPLTGTTVVSTSAYASSGQNGYVHGLLTLNQKGLFEPSQSAQQKNAADDAAAGPDYTLPKIAAQQPVQWPELSGTLMNGASSVAGQAAAYRYISYALVTQHYIEGAQGSHLDDLHYYFTGSNANYINYHYYDPRALAWPGGSSSGDVTWVDPVTGNAMQFTQADFNAVVQQVNTEIVYLVNSLNFLVMGPVNLKDTVASGNASASAALTTAAANILSSGLAPTLTKNSQVKSNISNILSMVSGIVSIAATVETDGIFSSKVSDAISKAASVIGGGLSTAAAVSGGLSTSTPSNENATRYSGFATAIGNLAQSQLQGQMSIGFDLEVDTILSDWGKLQALGPLVTDSSNQTFYSPNQIAQNEAVYTLSLAAERSYYISLMPSLYSVHYFNGFPGADTADSRGDGYVQQPAAATWGESTGWHPFYLPAPSTAAPSYSYVWRPTAGQYSNQTWKAINDACPIDVYVMAAPQPSSKGTNSTNMPTISQALGTQLFDPTGLALPMDEFVGYYGPFNSAFIDMNSSGSIYAETGFYGSDMNNNGFGVCYRSGGTTTPITESGPRTDTATTLTVPSTGVLGEPLTLSATVTASGAPVTGGSVYFLVDGTLSPKIPLGQGATASYTVNPTLGSHTYQALYSFVDNYAPSDSAKATVNIYANSPDLSVSLSQGSITTQYGSTSGPVAINVGSLSGMAGTVKFSCSGLPVNMGCTFDSPSATLATGGTVSTNLKIVDQTKTQASSGGRTLLISLGSTLGLLALWSARKRFERVTMLVAICMVCLLAGISGCSGSGSKPNPAQEAGPKTVLVNATCGAITKSVPLIVTVQ